MSAAADPIARDFSSAAVGERVWIIMSCVLIRGRGQCQPTCHEA